MVTRTYPGTKSGTITAQLLYGSKCIMITIPLESKDLVLPVFFLSQAGCELYDLLEPHFREDYIRRLSSKIKKTNPKVTVEYGKVVEVQGTRFKYELPLISI